MNILLLWWQMKQIECLYYEYHLYRKGQLFGEEDVVN